MKIENLEQYNNEDGTVNLDKLNEDIMKETNRSFNKGKEQAQSEFKVTTEDKPQEKADNNNVNNTVNNTVDNVNNTEVEELRNRLEEMENMSKADKEQATIAKFEKEARANGLTQEQIEFYKESSKMEALNNFKFDLVGRKSVENVGSKVDEPNTPQLTLEQEKSRLLSLARKRR